MDDQWNSRSVPFDRLVRVHVGVWSRQLCCDHHVMTIKLNGDKQGSRVKTQTLSTSIHKTLRHKGSSFSRSTKSKTQKQGDWLEIEDEPCAFTIKTGKSRPHKERREDSHAKVWKEHLLSATKPLKRINLLPSAPAVSDLSVPLAAMIFEKVLTFPRRRSY